MSAIRLPGFHVREEHPTHFVVQHAGVAPYRIAKRGLGEALLKDIRSYLPRPVHAQAMEHFAVGGTPVPPQAVPGDDVPPPASRPDGPQGESQHESELVQQLLALDQKSAADHATWQARGDQLFNEAVQAKSRPQEADPNRYFAQPSTAPKLSGALALILGGIGAGPTKQAQQIVQDVIDREVAAQRMNAARDRESSTARNRVSLYGHWRQQGCDDQDAQTLAKADLLDIVAGQWKADSAKYAGQAATNNAELQIGQLRQQAAQLRQDTVVRNARQGIAVLARQELSQPGFAPGRSHG
jgi:hypothetical protein